MVTRFIHLDLGISSWKRCIIDGEISILLLAIHGGSLVVVSCHDYCVMHVNGRNVGDE
jgi:hypothetical protein